jgi:peptidyl-prolyl cis-trans isomerase D
MAGQGLMNRMRDKTHIILIILVLAFLATIVFEWGMNYLGLRGNTMIEFGAVNGQEIKYTDFENQVQFSIQQQKQQTGEDPDESVVSILRDQVWEQMVTQALVQQEIKRLGITVTDQEILNWVYNSPQTLPDVIRRNFIDSTGNFNMALYQQVLATKTPEIEKFWAQVEDYLKQTLLSEKLQSVITGAVRVSEGDILQKYKDDNIFASFSYILFGINSVPDDQVMVSDEELKNYYNSHKEDFKKDESVNLKYILFSDAPTAEDSAITEKELTPLIKELKKANPADSSIIELVNTNSQVKWENKYYKPNELSSEVIDFLVNAKKDSVSDVIKASDGYHVVRLLDSKEGEDVFVNASHILINYGADSNASKLKAEQIYNRVKSGDDFSKLAAEQSDDASNKLKGGSLGWFTKGAMVKEFEEPVMSVNVGEIIGPIKTQFGFHIVKINDRMKKEFKIADIKQTVKITARSRDIIRKRAEDFSYVANKGNFEDEAKQINMQIQDIPALTKGSFIPGAGKNDNVIKFAFGESKGTTSEPIKINGGYAVYYIVDKFPAGYYSFDEIKANTLATIVRTEKKLGLAKQMAENMRAKIEGNDLNSLKQLDPNINVQTIDSFSVSKPDPKIGTDYDFEYELFKLQNGQISEPIRTKKGYYIVHMKSITPFDKQKYESQRDSLRTTMTESKKHEITSQWITDLKERAVIVDNRDKYFK